jgi:hypothetical protein
MMKSIDPEILNDLQDFSRDNSVGIASGYGLDGRGIGVRFSTEENITFSPQLPDRLRGPHSLSCNGHQRLFDWGKAAGE